MVFVALTLFFGCSKPTIDEKEAKEILHDFYTNKEPELNIDYDLLRAGKPIVPYLIVEIQKKNMPRRRYAIGALGKIGDRRAVPALIKILEDRSELDYFRGDALEAIWHIEKNVGEEFAEKHSGESVYIDRVIQLLRENKI